jgi:uncharacterized protein
MGPKLKFRKNLFGGCLFLLFVSASPTSAAVNDPCGVEIKWRRTVCLFSKTHFVHPAWGFDHSVRDYLLAKRLAAQDHVEINDDVLFAAAMLHDMGGFTPYAVDGVDHALRSTQVVEPVLKSAGFPAEEIEAVKSAILTHSYYCPERPQTSEALVLHDADTLDFMGDVSILRIFSIVGRETVTPDQAAAVALLKSFGKDLIAKIYGGGTAQREARLRASEMNIYLKRLEKEQLTLPTSIGGEIQ